MCTNFRPPARDLVAVMFDFPAPAFDYPEETYPGYLAPVVRRSLAGRFEPIPAVFGLIPGWSKDRLIARRTYNARSETVAEKPAFRNAWRRSQRALVPMTRFYEPDWTEGKAVRWRIEGQDQAGFAVAALWEHWQDRETGKEVDSFTLLTINADGHPVMGRFHRPGDEKRSLVPIAREDWAAWLDEDPETARRLLRPMLPGRFTAAPDPRPAAPRKQAAPAAQAAPGTLAAPRQPAMPRNRAAARQAQFSLLGDESENKASDDASDKG